MTSVDRLSSTQTFSPTPPARGGAQVDSASGPEQQASLPRMSYTNPRIRFDQEVELVVIEIRDIQNGEVTQSFPAKSTLEAYRRAARTGQSTSDRPDSGLAAQDATGSASSPPTATASAGSAGSGAPGTVAASAVAPSSTTSQTTGSYR